PIAPSHPSAYPFPPLYLPEERRGHGITKGISDFEIVPVVISPRGHIDGFGEFMRKFHINISALVHCAQSISVKRCKILSGGISLLTRDVPAFQGNIPKAQGAKNTLKGVIIEVAGDAVVVLRRIVLLVKKP